MEKIPEFIANHLFLFSLLIGLSALLLWNIFGHAAGGIMAVNPAETTRLMNHEKGIVLDLRKEEDFNAGHILNAVNIPEERISEQKETWSKYNNKPVILCCTHGNTSPRIARILKQGGLEKLYFLRGGVHAWRQANLPLASVSKDAAEA